MIPTKKCQEYGKEHTRPQKGMRNPKEMWAELSPLFFIFNSEVLSIFASDCSHAHCFLPVPFLIQALVTSQLCTHIPGVSAAKLDLGHIFFFYTCHAFPSKYPFIFIPPPSGNFPHKSALTGPLFQIAAAHASLYVEYLTI